METGEPLVAESYDIDEIYGGGRRIKRAYDFRGNKFGDGFVVVWRDITDRQRTEEALRESEEKYRGLFENINELVSYHSFLYDENGKVTDWTLDNANPLALSALGANSLDDIKGKTEREWEGDAAVQGMLTHLQRMKEHCPAGHP